MRLGATLFVASAVAVISIIVLTARALAQEPPPTAPTPGELQAKAERDRARRYARRLERVVQRQVNRAERNERRLATARRRFRAALRSSPVGNHWLESAFLCIHGYEGGWGAATGNGYYGGLQMDSSFMRSHGGEYLRAFGPANRWPRSVQIAVAIDAWTTRGFGPWPNTRHECGL